MQVTHGWAIFAGIAALSLPLLVHWLTRPRPRKMGLSTIRFVREIVHQRRATHRLRDILVLLARVAAVACLAIAFARPKGQTESLVSPEGAANTVRVVILDQSQSMAAVSGGISSFDRARAAAGQYLEYQSGVQANLLLCGAGWRPVFDRPSSNFAVLREQLLQATAQPQRLNAQAAVNAAVEMIQKVEGKSLRRELLIISDFQRSNWTSVDLSVVPADVVLSMQSTAEGPPPANLGITAIRPSGRAEEGQTTGIEVEVGNYSPAGREVEIELTLGTQVQRLHGFCAPGTRTALPSQVTLHEMGWQWGQARLVGNQDALPADDTRSFVIQVQRNPLYLLITRQSAKPHASSSHYLERALAPRMAQEHGERVVRVDPLNLSLEKLAAADMVVLDHPGVLPEEQVQWLCGLLRRGRGVLYVASEPADAVNLKRLAQAAGTDLHMPVEFAPPPTDKTARSLFWAEYTHDYAPFKAFGQTLQNVAGELRFADCLVSRRLEGGVESDILVTYNDRSAGLIRTTCGAGLLAVLNADLSTSNLPASPLFVPVISEVAAQLVARHAATDLETGEPVASWLPVDQVQTLGLTLLGPAGTGEYGSLVQDGQQISWRCASLPQPGIYRVTKDQQVVFAASAGLPAEESDLTVLDGQLLTKRMGAGHTVEFSHAQQRQETREWWPWWLAACAICMLLEWGVLRVFRT